MNIYRGRTHTEVYLASILYDSIEDQDFRSVTKLLVEKKADPNIVLPRRGISCFHLIIGSDSSEFALKVTMLIIQHGGDPNVRSDEGLTPVHIAAAWGRLDVLDLLLKCGGDPQLEDNCYKTALDYAKDEQWQEAVDLIQDFINYHRYSIYANLTVEDTCKLTLDKILVKNGNMVGEYEISTNDKATNTSYMKTNLNDLPQTNSADYVIDWCNSNHLNVDNLLNDAAIDHIDYDRSSLSSHSSHQRELLQKQSSLNVTKRRPHQGIQCSDYIAKDICFLRQSSRESGVLTLPESDGDDKQSITGRRFETYDIITLNSSGDVEKIEDDKKKDTSSDYCTCTDGSVASNILNQNIELSSSLNSDNGFNLHKSTTSTELSFVSVSEVYKYTDEQEGIVLYEKRIIRPSIAGTGNDSVITTFSQASLPKSFDYDTDTLRKELTIQGFDPGPITKTTKRVYLKKLYHLKKHPEIVPPVKDSCKAFSRELQKTLHNPVWCKDLSPYIPLEEVVKQQFTSPDPTRRWREGTTKSSFTYLLLDPRITENLPNRFEQLEQAEVWETFLSAIFYVGKGKRSRPYAHLYSAVSHFNKAKESPASEKLQRILDIWNDNHGVICLHLFQNTIPVEAYTREAAMITALKIENVTNVKAGDFYGVAATWSMQQKRMYGVYLLYKALHIFLHEGERQLFPNDID